MERIYIRRGTDLIIDLDVNCVDTTIEATYDVADQMMGNSSQAGLAVSIPVEFLTGRPRGQIEFQGAADSACSNQLA